MSKVLITGITGFIGSHIAGDLVMNGYSVIGLVRPESDRWRCQEFSHQITWLTIDKTGNYKNVLARLGIDSCIHCAWEGVESTTRDSRLHQIPNVDFFKEILEVSKRAGIRKMIALGSQAEYGKIDGEIEESAELTPQTAYASAKIQCAEILKEFCQPHEISWIWLRLFSVFGEKEGINWLIPKTIQNIKTGRHMELTPGEQQYAYMYVKDLSASIRKILSTSIESGVYNMSSNKAIAIRDVVSLIRDLVNPDYPLQFGTIPYREGQSMLVRGSIMKLEDQIGKLSMTDFKHALRQTVQYYLQKA